MLFISFLFFAQRQVSLLDNPNNYQRFCYHREIFGKCMLYQTFDDILGLDIIDPVSQHKLNVSSQ